MAGSAEQLRQKSYDPVASVRMLRFDIDNFEDGIQPETLERVYEEEMSYLVEGVNMASCTPFLLRKKGDQIVYFKEGKWQSYTGLLYTGLETARAEAAQDYRRQFLVHNATEDLVNGNIMTGLEPGQQHVWYSPYEDKVEALYGQDFMEDCGRQPKRRLGFVYRARCQEDGTILLESQTLDQSDEDGFAAIADLAELDPEVEMEELVATYDGVLYEKTGIETFAGRSEAERSENAWNEINKHHDLIKYHLNELEKIARRSLSDLELERATKRHTYSVWAAFKKRIEGGEQAETSELATHTQGDYFLDHQLHYVLEQETKDAFDDFVSKGFVMVGCGGGFSIATGEEAIMQANASEVHSSIFSGDKHGSLTFTCPNGHFNKRKYGELLKSCKREGCKAKVACT